MLITPAPHTLFESNSVHSAPSAASSHSAVSWPALYALDTACTLLGGRHGWVARHQGGATHIILRRDASMVIDHELESLLVQQARSTTPGAVKIQPWKNGTLLFAGIASGQAADDRNYVLGIHFEGGFELTERRSGILDGLRCSLQTYVSLLSPQEDPSRAVQRQTPPPVTCSCCRRVQTHEHGWMHWDDLRLMTTGRGATHTVCEKCADALYSDVLQQTL